MLSVVGHLLWLVPLPVAWLSPLADRPEWRLWMVLPFIGCWVVLRIVATQRTLTALMVWQGLAERHRTSRRWSPYLSSLPLIGVVWLLARPLGAGLDQGGWLAVVLVVAAVFCGLWGSIEVAVALAVVSSYLEVNPAVFSVLAAPAAGASLVWLVGGHLAEAVEERVRAAVAAGRKRQARRWALAMAPAALLLGPSLRAEICQLIATSLWSTGSAGRAVWWQRRVVGVRCRQRATRHQLNALVNVAMFEHTAARYDAAMRVLSEAERLLEKMPRYLVKVERLDPERIEAEIAAYRAEFAVETLQMLVATGEVSRAIAEADRALAVFATEDPAFPLGAPADSDLLRRLRTSHRDMMLMRGDVAGVYLHDEDHAEQIYEQVKAVAQRFDDRALAAETVLLTEIRLSAVLTRMGRYEEAAEKLLNARGNPRLRAVLGSEAPVVMNQANLARLRGDYVAAERGYREVLPALRDQVHTGLEVGVLTGLSDTITQRGKLAEAREMATRAVVLAERIGSEMLMRVSALNLGRICEKAGDDEAALRAYRRAVEVLESTRVRLVADEQRIGYAGGERRLEAYERLVAAHLRRGEIGEAFEYVERGKARALLDRLAETDQTDNSDGDRASGVEWRSPLGHEQVRASLAAAGRPVVVVEYFVCDDQLVVFAVRGDAEIQAKTPPVDLVEVRRFVQANFGSAGQVRDMTMSGLDELWHGFDMLVEPLVGWSQPGDVVAFVPHGVLHYLPLHALRVDGHYVIARNPIAYAPSASVLARSHRAQVLREGRAAVFGDPGGDLPHARAEAVSVADLFDSEAVLGAEVTPEAFVAGATGAALVHYAGHASFNAAHAGESGLHLSGGQMLTARRIQDLPGLLPRVVTLSGCETGISRRYPGDELIGLTRSFLYAGAATVVASLWRVADDSTTELMRGFYGHLAAGEEAVDALRLAMLEISARREWAALYHWAPFILVGDWE